MPHFKPFVSLKNTKYWPAVILLVVAFSCVTVYDTISNRDFADKYNPNKIGLNPQYKLYMVSPGKFQLYFKFFPSELAYAVIDSDSVAKAQVRIFYRVTKDYAATEIIDSMGRIIKIKGALHPQFLGYMPLNISEEGSYALEIFFVDLVSKRMVSEVIDFKVENAGNARSFMMISELGSPFFKNYFSSKDAVRIKTNMFAGDILKVSYYKPDTAIPIPPDTPVDIYLDPWEIDSTFEIPHSDTALLQFSKPGVYAFTVKNQLVGASYINVDNYFPYLKTPEKLLSALRYLCTPKEMKTFWEMESPKIAIDTFWLAATNDVDKARELIRIYYNRVQLANYYFTDYKEGWLTDRGMLYIIFGAPAHIQKNESGENWVYGKGATNEMQFYFYKDTHPVFGETYILDRSDLYTRIWFNAITAWREGRAFTLNP